MKWFKSVEHLDEVREIETPKVQPKTATRIEIPIETLSSLTGLERTALTHLTLHEGFPVLIKVLNAICYESTCRLMNAAPENREQVTVLHNDARCKHEFTSRLVGILRHLNAVTIPKVNPQQEKIENVSGNPQHVYSRNN